MMWKNYAFDHLIQEAECCNKSLRKPTCINSRQTNEHLVKVFTKVMLQGNI